MESYNSTKYVFLLLLLSLLLLLFFLVCGIQT